MTEQSKIPLPQKGKSLFERAESVFGLNGFKVAPVPGTLAPPANKRPPEKARPAVAAAPEPRPAAPSPEPLAFRSVPQRVDRARLRQRGMIVPEGQVTALIEEFRIVKRQVLLAARDARLAGGGAAAQRVLVSSPLPGEGKSFCAVNLALAIAAERDSDVLLVDADFAKPSILSLLGLAGEKGLLDALADPQVRIEDCVIPTDVPGLHVLPSGSRTSADSEYLASERTSEVLERLTRGAPNRIVIFDSPPALAASLASELAGRVGQTLVVCRADRTGQSALEDALSLLSACSDIKLLLNSAHFSPSGRRFGSYGYEGEES